MRLRGHAHGASGRADFPSFSEGLSLRLRYDWVAHSPAQSFPFLFGGTFIEAARQLEALEEECDNFPSFSEGLSLRHSDVVPVDFDTRHFPSFSEGLSLRLCAACEVLLGLDISLPFRRDFH